MLVCTGRDAWHGMDRAEEMNRGLYFSDKVGDVYRKERPVICGKEDAVAHTH